MINVGAQLFTPQVHSRLNVVPLDAGVVRGSHGLHPSDPSDGPLVIGPGEPPESMTGFSDYVAGILTSAAG